MRVASIFLIFHDKQTEKYSNILKALIFSLLCSSIKQTLRPTKQFFGAFDLDGKYEIKREFSAF